MSETPTQSHLDDAICVWDYHQMHQDLRPCEVAIGLGSHDPGVAEYAAELYHQGLFPLLVFSGATSRTTRARFPRGEAIHYRERALALGVPAEAIEVETEAGNTGENITLSRELLRGLGMMPQTVLLISKPYMERRAYATTRMVWPEVNPICASEPLEFDAYLESIGDPRLVLDMIVGDLQRVIDYPKKGFAIDQDVPAPVLEAYRRLIEAGYTSRLTS